MKIVLQKSTGQILEAYSGIEPDDETCFKNNIQIDRADLEIKLVTSEEYEEITNAYLKTTQDGYKIFRQSHYPNINEQLDDLFHQGAFSKEMTAKIQKVKDEFPKPE